MTPEYDDLVLDVDGLAAHTQHQNIAWLKPYNEFKITWLPDQRR